MRSFRFTCPILFDVRKRNGFPFGLPSSRRPFAAADLLERRWCSGAV